MYFSDSHIHLQAYSEKSAPQIIAEASACGVRRMICAAICESDWPQVAALARQFPQNVTPAFGLHPWYLKDIKPDWTERLRAVLMACPAALIGECGLDRLRYPRPEPQTTVFAAQLALAEELRRPLLIHAVKANDWLNAFWPRLRQVRFVLHSFNGRAELLQQAVGAGGYISFSPAVLRNRDFAALAALVPGSRLLIETDGPFQSPQGGESHPCLLPDLAEKLAAARGENLADLAAQMEHNFTEFCHV